MTRTRIVFLPSAAEEAPFQLVLAAGGGVLERGVLQPLNPAEAASARCVLVIPGVEVTVRWVNAPTRNLVQARAAAALALEDELAAPVGEAHLALGPLEADGRRAVAVVDPKLLSGWLARVAGYGLSPDVATPEALMLPEPGEGEPLNLARAPGRAALRGWRQAFSVEEPLAAQLLEGRETREPDSAELEQAMAQAAAAPAVNLLQGAFDPARGQGLKPRDLRLAAVLAALVLASPLLVMAAQVVRQESAARSLERQAAELAATVLPKGTAVEDPAMQVEARLAQARIGAGAGPTGLAAQLFAAVEALDQGQVESLISMPDGAMRATVSYANYSDIDGLSAAMRRAGVTVRQEGAREEAGRVVSDIILGARP
ncbi:MAG: type II secretion system protein GspL [Phenylobacterium sp.]|uniref:type II secretion system protein GspL n=1 Tax=Phenylobacterium sp. TaxID=1871053 RepID=UPI003919D1AE